MSDKEFLIDAVAEFLQADKWLSQVNLFFEENYAYFMDAERSARDFSTSSSSSSAGAGAGAGAGSPSAKLKEYRLDQHELFVKFKDMVERLLEQLIQELGCSPQEFVDILQTTAASTTGTSGERSFFLKTLLSFDDYEAFHERMYQFGREKQIQPAADSYSSSSTTTTTTTTYDGGAYPDATGGAQGGTDGYSDNSAVYSEWVLQETIANSILDSHNRGDLDPQQAHLVPWAKSLVELNQAAAQLAEAKEQDPEALAHYKVLEDALIRERLKVDLIVAQSIADANTEMKKQMLNLSTQWRTDESDYEAPTSTGATSGEEVLQSLFNELDQIRERLQSVKANCFSYKRIAPSDMDLIYLFLKEKIHFKADLVTQQNEIYDYIFAKVPQEDASVVPLLLEWLLLESEGIRMQNQIQDTLSGGGGGDGGSSNSTSNSTKDEQSSDPQYAWTQIWDDTTSSYYYYNRVTLESAWEPPASGYWDANNEFQYGSEATGEAGGEGTTSATPLSESTAAAASATTTTTTTTIDESVTNSAADVKQVEVEKTEAKDDKSVSTSPAAAVAEAKEHKDVEDFKTLGDALEAATRLGDEGDSSSSRDDLLQMQNALEKLSKDQEDERKRLELTLEIEKARQQEERRKRKEQRRKSSKHKRKHKRDQPTPPGQSDQDEKDGNDGETTSASTGESPLVTLDQEKRGPLPSIPSSAMLPPLNALAMPPVEQPPTTARRAMADMAADAKQQPSDSGASPAAPPPARSRINLSSLLTDTHALRHAEIKAARHALQQAVAKGTFTSTVSSQAFLNPTSLRFLTEQMLLNKLPVKEEGTPEAEAKAEALEADDAKA